MLGRATRLGFQTGLVLLVVGERVRPCPSLQSQQEMGEQEAGSLQSRLRVGSTWKRAGITHKPCCWVFFFFPPLIALAILTETDISLTIFKGYKCFMSLSSMLRQQLLLM